MAKVTCSDCGFYLGTEQPSAGTPCPQCNSTKATVSVEMPAEAVTITSAPLKVTVIDYPRILLQEAKNLIARKQFGIAILVAHIASEIIVQQALSRAFKRKGIPDLEEPMTEFLSGYSLANERLRKFYAALSGDDITKQPFWAEFKASAKRRNDFAHDGNERAGSRRLVEGVH